VGRIGSRGGHVVSRPSPAAMAMAIEDVPKWAVDIELDCAAKTPSVCCRHRRSLAAIQRLRRNRSKLTVVTARLKAMTELAPLPTVAADERSTLVEFLEYFRTVLIRKAEGLDETQARVRIDPSPMDLLGLVRHMALVEQWWFSQAFAGSTESDLWADPDDPDSDWHHTSDDTMTVATHALRTEIAKSQSIVAGAKSLDELTAIDVGPKDIPERYGRRSLRWIMVHMVEEYARHCGHADLLREVVDGAVGD
jgi:Protein of unknown function (DUF664)